jgi:hypothetical protein
MTTAETRKPGALDVAARRVAWARLWKVLLSTPPTSEPPCERADVRLPESHPLRRVAADASRVARR